MTIGDPLTAAMRDDLPFMRHRRRQATGGPPQRVVDFVAGRDTRRRDRTSPTGPTSSSDLELSDPVPLPSQSIAPGLPPAPLATSRRPRAVASGAVASGADVPRTRTGGPTILTLNSPLVALTRIQSGVGALRIEAACAASVGDLRLGCAYQLRSGLSSAILSSTLSNSTSPLVIDRTSRYEVLVVDLLRARDLARLITYAYSESGAPLDWGGTLVVTTFGADRIEIPLDRPSSTDVMVLMSAYNLSGEWFLRAEMEQIPGSVRDACDSYGFDEITWADSGTPLQRPN